MKIIAFIEDEKVIEKILEHSRLWDLKIEPTPKVRLPSVTISIDDPDSHVPFSAPPQGRLLLAYKENCLAGVGCLKALTPHTAEIKRMYVRLKQHPIHDRSASAVSNNRVQRD